MDPATIVPQVFKQSLVSGSKDNMSGILIYFGGQNFDANAESKKYIPGPLNPEDSRFVEKYKNDALKHCVHNWQELAAVISFLVFEDYLYIVFRRFQSTPQTISSHKALWLSSPPTSEHFWREPGTVLILSIFVLLVDVSIMFFLSGSIDPNFLFQLNSQLGEDENDDDMLN